MIRLELTFLISINKDLMKKENIVRLTKESNMMNKTKEGIRDTMKRKLSKKLNWKKNLRKKLIVAWKLIKSLLKIKLNQERRKKSLRSLRTLYILRILVTKLKKRT
jgi:predicted unusual protein kinase regulating ubiquinone biosynthesis (AarF/ABC1/UbiB family)